MIGDVAPGSRFDSEVRSEGSHTGTRYVPPRCDTLTWLGGSTLSTFSPSRSSPTASAGMPSKYTVLPIMPMGLGPEYSAGAVGTTGFGSGFGSGGRGGGGGGGR